jgi:Protein of unknown function (DUF2804)
MPATTPGLPYRGPTAGRPAGIPLPPARMPLVRGGRMRKRWRYVGAYGPELMLCVASVEIGPARQSFWAVWDREQERLHERTVMRAAPVRLGPGRVSVKDRGAEIELAFDEGPAIEVVTADDGEYAWTRKQAPVRVRGTVDVGGDLRLVDQLGIVDDSAGYHARHTAWRWSAGVGTATDGRGLAWNLVEGVHDSPVNSERTVWVDGTPVEVGPATFAQDLSSVDFATGERLEFAEEAMRARHDNRVIVVSDYAQPFGTFAGGLPGGIHVAEGFGVMERHDVRW